MRVRWTAFDILQTQTPGRFPKSGAKKRKEFGGFLNSAPEPKAGFVRKALVPNFTNSCVILTACFGLF